MIHDSLQEQGVELPLVSIIIPVYNTEDYLAVMLRSVLDQTYPNFEVICVDDGSKDRSAEIIKRFMCEDERIRLIQIKNHGPGYVRNLAIKEAKGEYISFVDSDDYLESTALDLSVARAEKDQSDFVVFDWKYFNADTKQSNYCNQDTFFNKSILNGEECLELLSTSPIYTMAKLFRRSFVNQHDIRYAEGHIYEDHPFWFKAVLCSKRVSLIHAPLYRLTTRSTSATKTNYTDGTHCNSYIRALESCWGIFAEFDHVLNARARYVLARYFLQKFMYYYFVRTPKHLRKNFLKRFVGLMAQFSFTDEKENELVSAICRLRVYEKKRYGLFRQMINVSQVYKPCLKKVKEKAKKLLKKIYWKTMKIARKCFRSKAAAVGGWEKYESYLKQPLYNDVILFLGFDYRYTGNSRYLFEEMLRRKPRNKTLFYVTDDPLVPYQHRIKPNSDRFNRFIARSKVVVFESWLPTRYKKRNGTTWVQLWHGTPIKRLLFDSCERYVTQGNTNNKNEKYKDIERWDYLLVDNPEVASYFRTCFMLPEEKLLASGYPRVKYLLDKKEDARYKAGLKELYGIPADKKIVLYLPTWRDYNYRVAEEAFDTDYLMDLKQLQALLGDEYYIVYKDHVFLSNPNSVDFKNYSDAETQELLLIADYLVTDYSSVLFDALAIDIPVYLFCSDFEKNEEARGLYPSVWNDLVPFVCDSEKTVAARICGDVNTDAYRIIKRKYCYRPDADDIASLLSEL